MYMIDSDAHFCSPGPPHFKRFSQNNTQPRNQHTPTMCTMDTESRIHLAFWVPLLTCASSCDASNAWPLGPAAFFREVRTIDLLSHMVP